MSYQVNRFYIWQNQTGFRAALNGTECTVTGPREYFQVWDESYEAGWPTDSLLPGLSVEHIVWAEYGDLRQKPPPSGEQSVMDAFKVTQPKRMGEPA